MSKLDYFFSSMFLLKLWDVALYGSVPVSDKTEHFNNKKISIWKSFSSYKGIMLKATVILSCV